MMQINKELLKEMVLNNFVSVQKHPEADLFIYNYTQVVQYHKIWNEITLQCRGLILDSDMNLVAKPFGKFFNLSEHNSFDIPNLPFDVYEKMDGSLGILYFLNNKPYIATRGSFTSEQAIHANNILYTKYKNLFDKLNPEYTYLFEIIYPKNRIVVDYGLMDDLILLSIINNKTGEEHLDDSIGFSVVKKYDGINDLDTIKTLNIENKEGFVVKFKNNFRIKIKFNEYVRLHKILTNVSSITVWEYLFQKKSFDELLEKVPDEFFNWIENTKTELETKFNEIRIICENDFKVLDTRKDTALYFKTKKYPSVLFSMLNNHSPETMIWKIVKPKYSTPFK